jgi:sensor c-di-GMP phosphodiesterase-like protein
VRRRSKIILAAALALLAGVTILFAATTWVLWNESVTSEEAYAGGLAATLGQNTERILFDMRDMLAGFDHLQAPRCSAEHLQALKDAAISRPYIRAIGYWQANERQCDVGFLPQAIRPARADRIYENGVIAWWPSAQTQAAGVQLFLMRYGDHDVAIDPRLLLDIGPTHDREAVLWVENRRMSAVPWDAALPQPDALKVGITLDHEHDRVVSLFSRNRILPIDVVAMEPLQNFWDRHTQILALGASLGLLMIVAWISVVMRYSRRELSLATELRRAVEAGQIAVHYQPVIELVSGRCVGAEALARWQRDNGERVSPNVFIPVAEAAGMIQDVTVAVLTKAAHDMQRIRAEFPAIAVNLNLAPDDLKNDRVGHELSRVLASERLPAAAIKLEITERALINSETSRSLIREFRRRGHQVAIDDFGTGYSSLSYLQSFELDVLKIDKAFVDAIGTEAATSQVIVHVIEMAKSLGLATVAEGVETRSQADWLIAHGVPFGQGFLFSKPLAIDDFLRFLRLEHAHAKRPSR